MFSSLFCGSFEPKTEDFKKKTESFFGLKLYKIEIQDYLELTPKLIKFLSPEEVTRSGRYHFLKDKNRFVICRFLLKWLLADYLNLKFEEINITNDSNKKPYLVSHQSLFFNVSHSGDYAIIAIAKFPIGIDIEFVNQEFEFEEILPTVFSKDEIDEIVKTSNNHHAFFKFWTRKEAVVKAIGKGIDGDLINIPITDGHHSVPSSLLHNLGGMSVYSFDINEEYIGALAITEELNTINDLAFSPIPTANELKALVEK